MPAIALVQVLVPLLPALAGDVSKLVEWIAQVRSAAKQSGEWDEATENAFRKSLIDSGMNPDYLRD